MPKYRNGWFLEFQRAPHPTIQEELLEELLVPSQIHGTRYHPLPSIPADYYNRWAAMGQPGRAEDRIDRVPARLLPATAKRVPKYPLPSPWVRPGTMPPPRIHHGKLCRQLKGMERHPTLCSPMLKKNISRHNDQVQRDEKMLQEDDYSEKAYMYNQGGTDRRSGFADTDVQAQYAEANGLGAFASQRRWNHQKAALQGPRIPSPIPDRTSLLAYARSPTHDALHMPHPNPSAGTNRNRP